MKRTPLILTGLIMVIVCLASIASGDVPQLINYQGRLTDSTGAPMDTTVSMVFTIYDIPTGSPGIWYSGSQPVTVEDGLFTYQLGSVNPLGDDIFTDTLRWLGIRVGTDQELSPRTRLITVPYAYHALRADSSDYANNIADGSVTNSKIAAASVTDDKLADGAVTNPKLANLAVTSGKIADQAVSSTKIADESITSLKITNGTIQFGDISQNGAANGQIMKWNGSAWAVAADDTASGGVIDHGDLEGLLDNDHPQYLLTSGGTVNGDVLFGDSIMRVCSDMVVIGNHSCYSDRSTLLKIDRYLETDVGIFYGIYLDVTNEVSAASARGIYSTMSSYNGPATGVRGNGECGTVGTSIGVEGRANGGLSAYGIVGHASGGSNDNYAGMFYNDVDIYGTLTKSGGSFKIDHPLDPENKYLQHSFVESPDMMNVYNGNATLNGNGEITVELPEWFDALNRDFRYQLTPIGAPGPNLYIGREIYDNSFEIFGGEPGMKVSWQVTGIRHDKWAESNRIQVELEKRPNKRGLYRSPELYGFDLEKHVDHEVLKEMEEESNEQ